MKCEVCGKPTEKVSLTVKHCPECGTVYKGDKVKRPIIIQKFVLLTQAMETFTGKAVNEIH